LIVTTYIIFILYYIIKLTENKPSVNVKCWSKPSSVQNWFCLSVW